MAISDLFKIRFYKSIISNLTEENETLKTEIAQLNSQVKNLNSKLRSNEIERKRLEDYVHSFLPLFDASRLKIPANYESLKELWNRWGKEVHTMETQIIRQDRARSEIYTPISLDPDFAYGKFHGHNCDYQTNLTRCQCKDFQIRALPCKHIYRLAYELELFYLDDVRIHPDIANILRIDDVKKMLNHLIPTQYELFRVAVTNGLVYSSPAKLQHLIDCRLLQLCDDKHLLLDAYTKDELCDFVQKISSSRLPKSKRKQELIEIIISDFPEVITQLEVTMAIAIPSIYVQHLLKEIHEII